MSFVTNRNYGVKIISSDSREFVVPTEVASLSVIMNEIIEHEDEDDSEIVIPVDVNGKVMENVLEFCKHFVEQKDFTEIEKPLSSKNMIDFVPEWYVNFINKMDQDFLFEIISAANYLDIKPLLELSCAKVATMIRDKTPDEIRKLFNVEEKVETVEMTDV